MSYSLDANILLYASNTSCAEHARASEFLRECAAGTEILCLGWPTLMAYLRFSTHPAIFPTPLSVAEASRNLDSLLGLPQVRTLSELEGFWPVYLEVAERSFARGNQVPDAHLAALLKHNGVMTLYTADLGFRRYDFLEVINPLV